MHFGASLGNYLVPASDLAHSRLCEISLILAFSRGEGPIARLSKELLLEGGVAAEKLSARTAYELPLVHQLSFAQHQLVRSASERVSSSSRSHGSRSFVHRKSIA